MSRFSILVLAVLISPSSPLFAQAEDGGQDFAFQLSSTRPWIDTGIELQPGEVIRIAATAAQNGVSVPGVPHCNPAGVGAAAAGTGTLPLPTAPAGALIARLEGEASSPVLVGTGTDLQIKQASHVLLGMNASGTPACQGVVAIKLEKLSASAIGSDPGQTRGQQLKSELLNAAEIFMEGQFGEGKNSSTGSSESSAGSSDSEASSPPRLTVSDTDLDGDFRSHLAGLPRRVNDQFNNPGDMVNFVIVGNQADVEAALESASWHIADTSNTNAMVNAIHETYNSKDYLAMPMSTLFLFGRKQDFGYEMAEPIAMIASRHHFRIWKAPFACAGKEVWVGAGTHDIGFAKDRRNNNVTHKIDPAVDGERDNIGSSLEKNSKLKTLTYYLPPDPVEDAKNATGDRYHSDGRLLVMFLQ